MALYVGQYGPEAVLDATGALVPSTPVTVYDGTGTSTAATLYTDETATTTASNPVNTDAYGNLTFFATPGQYTIQFTSGGNTTTLTITVPPWPVRGATQDVSSTMAAGNIGAGSNSSAPTITIPSAGEWDLQAFVQILPSGSTTYEGAVYIEQNGTTVVTANWQVTGDSDPGGAQVSYPGLVCAANDVLTLVVSNFAASPGSVSAFHSAPSTGNVFRAVCRSAS